MRFLSTLRWFPLCLLASCSFLGLGPKGLDLSTAEKGRMDRLLVEREYVLASTVTGAEFFGQNDRYFVDARPVEILDLYRHTNDPAPVRLATKITLPAGTPVTLKQILYPLSDIEGALDDQRDPHGLAPTAHTWLVSEYTSPEGVTLTLVFVLPRDISSAEQFEAAVRDRLLSPMWVTTWLSHRAPKTLNAIYQKNIIAGMSRAEATAALGTPRNHASANDDAMLFEADYGDLQVLFEGGVVTQVRSLKVEAEVARMEAMEKARLAQIAAEELQREQEAEAAELALKKAEEDKARAEVERVHAEKLAKLELERQAAVAAAQEVRRAAMLKAAQNKPAPTVTTASLQTTPQAAPTPTPKSRPMATTLIDLDAEAEGETYTAPPVTVRPFILGAVVHSLTADKAKALGLRRARGALVTNIRARGVALQMGLRTNDVITKVNRKSIRKKEDLAKIVKALTADSTVTMTVWRNGKSIQLPQKRR
ncbi:MAG: PDZ domain-containing protein [Myxococcota bacterium]|nr:PDZ domain-containing protein [Myxococcota bacterium]